MNRRILPALILAVITLSSCSIFGNADKDRLQEARDRWTAKHITDYSFRFNWSCFCPHTEKVVITVRSGAISEVHDATTGALIDSTDGWNYAHYRTIDGLFDFINDAIEKDADEITVTYDSELGYPRTASIDYYKNAMDDEAGFNADSLARR